MSASRLFELLDEFQLGDAEQRFAIQEEIRTVGGVVNLKDVLKYSIQSYQHSKSLSNEELMVKIRDWRDKMIRYDMLFDDSNPEQAETRMLLRDFFIKEVKNLSKEPMQKLAQAPKVVKPILKTLEEKKKIVGSRDRKANEFKAKNEAIARKAKEAEAKVAAEAKMKEAKAKAAIEAKAREAKAKAQAAVEAKAKEAKAKAAAEAKMKEAKARAQAAAAAAEAAADKRYRLAEEMRQRKKDAAKVKKVKSVGIQIQKKMDGYELQKAMAGNFIWDRLYKKLIQQAKANLIKEGKGADAAALKELESAIKAKKEDFLEKFILEDSSKEFNLGVLHLSEGEARKVIEELKGDVKFEDNCKQYKSADLLRKDARIALDSLAEGNPEVILWELNLLELTKKEKEQKGPLTRVLAPAEKGVIAKNIERCMAMVFSKTSSKPIHAQRAIIHSGRDNFFDEMKAIGAEAARHDHLTRSSKTQKFLELFLPENETKFHKMFGGISVTAGQARARLASIESLIENLPDMTANRMFGTKITLSNGKTKYVSEPFALQYNRIQEVKKNGGSSDAAYIAAYEDVVIVGRYAALNPSSRSSEVQKVCGCYLPGNEAQLDALAVRSASARSPTSK